MYYKTYEYNIKKKYDLQCEVIIINKKYDLVVTGGI